MFIVSSAFSFFLTNCRLFSFLYLSTRSFFAGPKIHKYAIFRQFVSVWFHSYRRTDHTIYWLICFPLFFFLIFVFNGFHEQNKIRFKKNFADQEKSRWPRKILLAGIQNNKFQFPLYLIVLFTPANCLQINSIHGIIQNPRYSKLADLYLDNNSLPTVKEIEGAEWFTTFRVLSLRGNMLKQVNAPLVHGVW